MARAADSTWDGVRAFFGKLKLYKTKNRRRPSPPGGRVRRRSSRPAWTVRTPWGVISGTAAGGQLMITTDVENYPGFPSGVQGPELMELWRKQAERFKAEFVDDNVSRVEFGKPPFRVWTSDGTHQGHSVIIATGANAKYLGLPNEQRLKGHGVSACAACDGFFFKTLDVVVVGGGEAAMEV